MIKKIKKTISPVVATALLLVVAVVAVVSFQTWFGSYSSGIFSEVEIKSNSASQDGMLAIETLIGNTLYVKNGVVDNLTIQNLKIGSIECNLTNQENLSLGMNEIDVEECLANITTSTPNVVLITKNKILDKQFFVKKITPLQSCSLDSITIKSGQSAVFYNISGGSVCYSQIRTCSDGVLNGSISYNHSSCQVVYDLSCATDLDGDGFIDSACAVYPMTNTTYFGDLDTNDNNATIHPDMSCILNDYRNSPGCINNLIVDGCGVGTVLDISTNLCWQRDMTNAGTKTWANAISYCDGLTLGGQTDWRLPTNEELLTITDLSGLDPAVIGGDNNKFQNVQSNYYWSYSNFGPDPVNALVVLFSVGYVTLRDKANPINVICVR